MAVCEKCGCTCNQLHKGGKFLGAKVDGYSPDSPGGRGYYLVCSSCKKKADSVAAHENDGANALTLFVLQLLVFAAPGIALFTLVNQILGGIVAVAGIVGYFILRAKKPKIVKIINIIAVILVAICIGIRGF